MVTAAKETKPKTYRWDYFLREMADSLPAQQSRALMERVARYRKLEWKNVRRQLQTDFSWAVSDEAEPHWIDVGSGVYGREIPTVKGQTSDGKPAVTHGVDKGDWVSQPSGEWEHTPPLPANNAAQIAQRLRKGFRLRPPGDKPDVWRAVESAVQPVVEAEIEPPKFTCDRHGHYGFRTWDHYINHCTHFKEPPIAEAPVEVIENLNKYDYACYEHNQGFNNAKHAAQHRQNIMGRGGRAIHATVQEMALDKG